MNNKAKNQIPSHQAVAKQQNGQQQAVAFQQTVYQGAIPPPELLARFDEIVPGAAARLILAAETESNHRRKLEQQAQDANIQLQQQQLSIAEYQSKATFNSDALGQILGFLVCALCIAGCVWLALFGFKEAAIALTVIPTAAIIQAFRLGNFKKSSSSQKD
jgi:uncharacterized membrane protein